MMRSRAMTFIVTILFFSMTFLASPTIAATRLFYEDFESYSVGGVNSGSNDYASFWTTASVYCTDLARLGITNSNPFGGSRALRGNAWNYNGIKYDPITGLQTENSYHANLGGEGQSVQCGADNRFDIYGNISTDLWVVIQLRFDSNFNNPNVGSKIFTFWNGSGEFYIEMWATRVALYGNGIVAEPDFYDFGVNNFMGAYHEFMVHIDFANDRIAVYRDGVRATSLGDCSAGACDGSYVRYTGSRVSDFYLMFIHETADLHCSNHCGWQIDDIAVWDGQPSKPPNPPNNLRIVE